MASDNMKHRRLQELGDSDFEIVDGQPDIRGWDVRNERDQKIGEVEELILDAKNRKVRYLVVDLDDNELDLEDKEVLIPIGMAELHEDDDDVVVKNLTVDQLSALPEYDEDNLTPDVERNICMALGRTNSGSTTSASLNNDDQDLSFYQQEHFNDANLYRRRLPSSGSTGSSFDSSSDLSSESSMNRGSGLNSGSGLNNNTGNSGSNLGSGSGISSDSNLSGSTGSSSGIGGSASEKGSGSGSGYDFSRGYGLRDRSESKGEGSLGNLGSSYGTGTNPGSRGSMYREEEINEDAAVPVNRPRNTGDEPTWNKETDIDNLTGDNNRGIRGGDFDSSEEDDIRRTER